MYRLLRSGVWSSSALMLWRDVWRDVGRMDRRVYRRAQSIIGGFDGDRGASVDWGAGSRG